MKTLCALLILTIAAGTVFAATITPTAGEPANATVGDTIRIEAPGPSTGYESEQTAGPQFKFLKKKVVGNGLPGGDRTEFTFEAIGKGKGRIYITSTSPSGDEEATDTYTINVK